MTFELIHGIAMAGIGAPWFAHGLWSILQGYRAKHWPRTTGQVTASRLSGGLRLLSNDFGFFDLSVSYLYHVDGALYNADRILFGAESFDNQKLHGAAETRANKYRIGDPVVVYYDPRRPSRAVLEPGVTFATYVYLVLAAGLAFTGVSILVR